MKSGSLPSQSCLTRARLTSSHHISAKSEFLLQNPSPSHICLPSNSRRSREARLPSRRRRRTPDGAELRRTAASPLFYGVQVWLVSSRTGQGRKGRVLPPTTLGQSGCWDGHRRKKEALDVDTIPEVRRIQDDKQPLFGHYKNHYHGPQRGVVHGHPESPLGDSKEAIVRHRPWYKYLDTLGGRGTWTPSVLALLSRCANTIGSSPNELLVRSIGRDL